MFHFLNGKALTKNGVELKLTVSRVADMPMVADLSDENLADCLLKHTPEAFLVLGDDTEREREPEPIRACIDCGAPLSAKALPAALLHTNAIPEDADYRCTYGLCSPCCDAPDDELVRRCAEALASIWPGLRRLEAAHLSAEIGRA